MCGMFSYLRQETLLNYAFLWCYILVMLQSEIACTQYFLKLSLQDMKGSRISAYCVVKLACQTSKIFLFQKLCGIICGIN